MSIFPKKKKQKPQPKSEDVVTLTSSNGEDIDFVEIAGIAFRGDYYAILQPIQLLDGMDDDEALVFKVSRGRDGKDHFELEMDDFVVDKVFEEYDRLYAEAHRKK